MKIIRRYMIMLVRMKISYLAFSKQMTVHEHWLITILETYKERCKSGLVEMPYVVTEEQQMVIKLINGKENIEGVVQKRRERQNLRSIQSSLENSPTKGGDHKDPLSVNFKQNL